MKIEAHIVTWNRYDTIHLTVHHYRKFCSRVVVHDNFSDDGTWDLAETLGAECKLFGKLGILDDQEYVKVKNNCWKGSDADWVIIVDDDEIIYHPNLITELQLAKDTGATILKPKGFGIYSNDTPRLNWTEVMTGLRDEKYDKLCCFDPKKITDINYVFGCHEAKPKGLVRQVDKLWLLHYMAVGGAERMIKRHKQYAARLSDFNRRWKCGIEYTFSPESKREWFQERLVKSAPLYVGG